MRVLVTRPVADAQTLAAEISARGHEPVLAPLLDIQSSTLPPPDDLSGATLLFTSANGVRAAAMHRLVSPAVYAVGAATAEAARSAGYSVAGVASGNVGALAELVAARVPVTAKLYHVTGSDTAGDLKGELARRGFAAKSYVAYRAIAAKALPEAAAQFLSGVPGAVTLFSPRTAQVLNELVSAADLKSSATQHRLLALSDAVATAARNLPWRSVEIAATPETGALLALL